MLNIVFVFPSLSGIVCHLLKKSCMSILDCAVDKKTSCLLGERQNT